MTDQLNDKFLINNTLNNRALEAMSVDIAQTRLLYATEQSLISDTSLCSNCVRISVNEFTVNVDDTIDLNELYEFRYDLDTVDTTLHPSTNAFVALSDLMVFKDQEHVLKAFVVERTYTGKDVSMPYENRIYLADLSDISKDTKQCYSLSEDACKDIEPIQKTLLFTFPHDVEDETWAQTFGFLNFEAISIVYDGNSVYDEDGAIHLVVINDNGELVPTFFVYLKYTPPVQPTTTVLLESTQAETADDENGSHRTYAWMIRCHVLAFSLFCIVQ
eukprot:501688_1